MRYLLIIFSLFILSCENTITKEITEEAEENTIRKKFANSIQENAVHGSDSEENAVKELEFFFNEN